MVRDIFFRDKRLPFVECRSSQESDEVFKPHMHKSFSIGVVVSGQVNYTVWDQENLLVPGALAIINPETLHSCNSTGTDTRSFYMLYLDAGWCLNIQQSMWETGSFIPAETVQLYDESLYHLYCATIASLLAPDIHLVKKEQQLVQLVSSIFRATCTSQSSKPQEHGNIDFLKEILSDNLDQDLSLESVAVRTGNNLYTMIRQFKAATGMTPHAYRMNCRIEKVRLLLRQGKDIADTALECGFFDQSHMHRYFKAMTTVTPNQYRVNFLQ